MGSKRWYISKNKKTFGPLSFLELQERVEAQQVSMDDYAIEEGSNDWIKIGDIGLLQLKFEETEATNLYFIIRPPSKDHLTKGAWYFLKKQIQDGSVMLKQMGPFTKNQIEQMVGRNELSANDLIVGQDNLNWTRVARAKGLHFNQKEEGAEPVTRLVKLQDLKESIQEAKQISILDLDEKTIKTKSIKPLKARPQFASEQKSGEKRVEPAPQELPVSDSIKSKKALLDKVVAIEADPKPTRVSKVQKKEVMKKNGPTIQEAEQSETEPKSIEKESCFGDVTVATKTQSQAKLKIPKSSKKELPVANKSKFWDNMSNLSNIAMAISLAALLLLLIDLMFTSKKRASMLSSSSHINLNDDKSLSEKTKAMPERTYPSESINSVGTTLASLDSKIEVANQKQRGLWVFEVDLNSKQQIKIKIHSKTEGTLSARPIRKILYRYVFGRQLSLDPSSLGLPPGEYEVEIFNGSKPILRREVKFIENPDLYSSEKMKYENSRAQALQKEKSKLIELSNSLIQTVDQYKSIIGPKLGEKMKTQLRQNITKSQAEEGELYLAEESSLFFPEYWDKLEALRERLSVLINSDSRSPASVSDIAEVKVMANEILLEIRGAQ